ncbi:GNAT family N-acetyltransferase [Bradyrhizobium sp. CER78]|uniref:GNAT family N-acetyltransferase n=1 Tax=Bradyrhizobium sp. CER78 TaxID=3039162 RepID=UPI002449C71F|nr:GNAT family N-acetyltransferase [Bradyrhizobium sp. CER78]MDH2382199.1 GNAT family N-acetyltransferase [Bradyrhizobium sp. CER78]
MRSFQVRPLEEGETPAYEEFLKENSRLPLYGMPSFLRFLEATTSCRTHVLVAWSDGAIVGGLPYAELHRDGVGRIVNSLPWYGSHGSVIVGRAARSSEDADAIRRALLSDFVAAADGGDLLSATMILLPDEEAHVVSYDTVLQPIEKDARIGQITELPPVDRAADGLELTFKQKTRNLVRKSLKQGFSEQVTDDDWAWKFLAETHAENMAAIGGKPKPESHFHAMRETLPPRMRRLSVCMSDGAPAAALLLLQCGDTCEYITPVIVKDFRPRQPLTFLIWMGMLDAIRSGCRRWNWGGTWHGQENLHHFKAGFGAVDLPYSYLIRAPHEGVLKLKQLKSQLGTLFPNFYAYPYAKLD